MAVTITPQKPGRRGGSLTMTPGEDPTYVEIPRLPIFIVVAGNDTTDRTVSVRYQKDITTDPQEGAQLQKSINFGATTIEDQYPYLLIVKPNFSEIILDESTNPPRVELFGSDLTNCFVGAFDFRIL